MKRTRDEEIQERMRTTFELSVVGEEMMRLNLRRRYPEADDEEIEERLSAWLQKRDRPFLPAPFFRALSPEEVEARFGPVPDEPIPPPEDLEPWVW